MNSKFIKMLTARQVAEMAGISRSTVYDWRNEASPRHDPTFPKQVRLTEKGNATRWYLHEIEEWLATRPRNTA